MDFKQVVAWLKKRLMCKCMVDYDADGKPDLSVGWDGDAVVVDK